jgi:hypothetical protein
VAIGVVLSCSGWRRLEDKGAQPCGGGVGEGRALLAAFCESRSLHEGPALVDVI